MNISHRRWGKKNTWLWFPNLWRPAWATGPEIPEPKSSSKVGFGGSLEISQEVGLEVGLDVEVQRKPTFRPTCWPISWILPKPTIELLFGYSIFGGFRVLWLTRAITMPNPPSLQNPYRQEAIAKPNIFHQNCNVKCLRPPLPYGPKDWKKSRSPSGIEIFNRDWKFQASHPANPYFCGELWRSGLKFSIGLEIFYRDWFFESLGP